MKDDKRGPIEQQTARKLLNKFSTSVSTWPSHSLFSFKPDTYPSTPNGDTDGRCHSVVRMQTLWPIRLRNASLNGGQMAAAILLSKARCHCIDSLEPTRGGGRGPYLLLLEAQVAAATLLHVVQGWPIPLRSAFLDGAQMAAAILLLKARCPCMRLGLGVRVTFCRGGGPVQHMGSLPPSTNFTDIS